jgi:D-alanine transaminase
MAALREADEVFITSTGNDVTPIVAIDGAPVAYGEPGPLTVAAQQAFRAGQARDLEP